MFQQRFHPLAGISLMDGYDVVACDRCGLVYADRIPPSERFERYYADASKYEYSHRNGEQHTSERERVQRLAERIAANVGASARLLDVGSSTGELLVALRGRGFADLTGLDPSLACVQHARTKYRLRMLHQAFGVKPADVSPFDVVVLSAVLEHVPDLHDFLRLLDLWLVPGGSLVIEVPDAENFAQASNAPYQEFSVEHINFFSAPALDNLLRVHGYASVAVFQEMCSIGRNLTSPVLTGIYRSGAERSGPIKETVSMGGVQAYLDDCLTKLGSEQAVIADLVQTQTPVLVWGVGTLCQRLLSTTRLGDANIVGFVDSNPHYQGTQFAGRRVLAPSDLIGRNEAILILSWGFFEEICSQIRGDLKLANHIISIR